MKDDSGSVQPATDDSESNQLDNEEVDTYVCITCDATFEDWVIGQCPECGAWSSIRSQREVDEEEAEHEGERDEQNSHGARPIDEIEVDHAIRIPTGITELDRVLGGGAVLGGVTLVGGDPGVGKSTLLLQALASLSALGFLTLYVTAEESANQVAARARRIQNVVPENLYLTAETSVEDIIDQIKKLRPKVMVIDSIQTIHTSDNNAGSIVQLREVTSKMISVAQRLKISTFLVGHVTKDGGLAGPKVIEHLVDTVLAFEGERGQAFRTLRTQKNRHGSATEVGIFEMTANGMKEVPNASEFFLAERNEEASGSIIAATSEGNRSMLVEVQALVSNQIIGGGNKPVSNGIDASRLSMILGILDKCLEGKKSFDSRNIFINIAGGMSISEPALDLPIALALVSALVKQPIHAGLVAFGEIGLTGEIRGVPRVPTRLSEAATMGFEGAIVPHSVVKNKTTKSKNGLTVLPVRTLDQAIHIALPDSMLTQKQPSPAADKASAKRGKKKQ